MMFSNYIKKTVGFTLFELMVAIAVVSLMFGIVATQAGDWFGLNIKSTTNKLGSTIRYLHDKASSENIYIRLVIDFQKNSYWVEATSERMLLTTKEVEAEDEEEEIDIGELTEEGEEIEIIEKYKTPEFGSVDEFLLKPVKLPDGVFFKDIYTAHDREPVSAGQAFIYFFPNGYIEPAVINLRDEDDEINFSLKINPIIGKVKVLNKYKEMEWEE